MTAAQLAAHLESLAIVLEVGAPPPLPPLACPYHGTYRVPTCPVCSAAQTLDARYTAHVDRRQGKD